MEHVAIHEAGHAVMAWLHVQRVDGLTVRLDSTGLASMPRCVTAETAPLVREHGPDAWKGWKWGAWCEARILAAGPLAERRLCGGRRNTLPGAVGDHNEVTALVDAVLYEAQSATSAEFLREHSIRSVLESTRRTVARPRFQAAVQALAISVLEAGGNLTGDEVERIIKGSGMRRGRPHWKPPSRMPW